MFARLSFVLAGVLTGCTSATPVQTGSVAENYLIECPATYPGLSTCTEKANSLCPNGYDVTGENVDSVFLAGVQRRLGIVCR